MKTIDIGVWLLLFPIGSFFCVGTMIWFARWNHRYRKLIEAQHFVITETMSVIECLSHRGKITCDICDLPIAPRTPTVIEEHEPHIWTLAHKHCIERIAP